MVRPRMDGVCAVVLPEAVAAMSDHADKIKQWQAIWDAKKGPCRACSFRAPAAIDPHHLVFREDGGDDVAANIVPICRQCHEALHNRATAIARLLLTRLSDAEYAYMVERGGEDYAERVYGIEYTR